MSTFTKIVSIGGQVNVDGDGFQFGAIKVIAADGKCYQLTQTGSELVRVRPSIDALVKRIEERGYICLDYWVEDDWSSWPESVEDLAMNVLF